MTEAYAKNMGQIHFYFLMRVVGVGFVPRNYCVVFNRSRIPLDLRNTDRGSSRFTFEESEGGGHHKHNKGQAMLVDARKLVEHPQRVRGEFLASVVWLQPLDDCPHDWRNAPDSPFACFGTHGLAENRKLGVFHEFGRRRISVAGDQKFVDEVVKSGT